MADYNRNKGGSNRGSNQEWNDNNNRNEWDENNDSSWQHRSQQHQRNSGEGSDAYLSRHERERDDDNRFTGFNSGGGSYSGSRYGRHYQTDFNSGNYGGDRNYGYSSYYGAGNTYGSGDTSGSNYGSGSSQGNWNANRNLYDRDYQGTNRSSYEGTRVGGANYGNYGDRDRRYHESKNEGRGYGGYGNSHDRDRNPNDRNWWDRATDEVSSWFGDEDAERRRRSDRETGHRGKGPKNYNRSDDRIKEDINDRLSDDPFVDATDIDVTVSNGEVTLTGTVDHRSSKRRAEDIAEAVSGVKNVENRIRVSTSVNTTGSSATSPVSSGNSSNMGSRGSEASETPSDMSTERSKNKRDYVAG